MRLFWVSVTVLGMVALQAKAQEQPVIQIIAASWWDSDREDSTTFRPVGLPAVNDKGAVFFAGFHERPGRVGLRGAYIGGDGGFQELAVSTEAVPGDDRYLFLDRLYNHVYPGEFTLNDSAQSLFTFAIYLPGVTYPPDDTPYGESMWYSGGGSLKRLLSQANDPPPGFPATTNEGVKFHFDRFQSPRITNSGVYAFTGDVYAGNQYYDTGLYWGHGGSVNLAARGEEPGAPRFQYYDMARDVGIGYYIADSPGSDINSDDSVYRFLGSESELILGPGSRLPGLAESPLTYSLWDVDESGVALVVAWPFRGAAPSSASGLYLLSFTGSRLLLPFNQEILTEEGPVTLTLPLVGGSATILSDGWAYFHANYQGFGRSGLGRFRAHRHKGLQLLYTFGAHLPGTSLQATEYDGNFVANAYGATASMLKIKGEGVGDGQFPVSAIAYQDLTGQFHVFLWSGQTVQVDGQQKTVSLAYIANDGLTDGGELVCFINFQDGSAALCRVLPPDAIEIQGSLTGTLRSSQQTATELERAVHRAVVTVYTQPSGWIRSRNSGESGSDYDEYVRSFRGSPVRRMVVTETDEGKFSTPLLQALKLQNTGVLREAFYTLEITSAETDEWYTDDQGVEDRSRTEPLNFLPLLRANVRAPTEGLVLELQPVDEPGIKRNLAENLSAMAPNYWGPPEALVLDYLDDLESGTQLTAERREGLRRAILGERAVLQAGDFADAFIKELLTSLGNLLADIYSDATKKDSDALKQAKTRVQNATARPGFNVPQPGAALAQAASQADFALVERADIMGLGSNFLKLLKPHLEFGLVQAGMNPPLAADFSKYFVIACRSILNGLKDAEASRTRRGANAASLGIQEVIKGLVKQLHPVFFDGSAFSFTAVTADVLEDSHLWMTTWDDYDDADFLSDRAEYNQFYTEFLLSMESYSNAVMAGQIAAEYFSSAEAVFSIGGLVVKQAKGAEYAAKFAKYLSHIEAVVVSAGTIYGVIPFKLGRLNRIAFDYPEEPLAMSAQVTPGDFDVTPMSVTTGIPDDSAVLAALTAVEQGLAANDLGAVLTASVDPAQPTALAQAHADWKKGYRRYETAATAAAAVRDEPALQQQINLVQQKRINLLGAEVTLGEELGLLFEGVLGGRFVNPQDAAYIAKRSDVLVALEAFRSAISATTRELGILDALLDATPGPVAPALVLEPGPATSNTTGGAHIAAPGETFTIRMTAYNAGGSALPALPVRLTLVPEGAASADQPVKSLSALAAGAEGALEWTVTIGAIDYWSTLFVSAEVNDEAAVPAGLVDVGAEWVLNVDPAVFDADLDGMPDDFESSYGINPALNDAGADHDGDLLSNLQEFNLGTRPDFGDTDGDGVSDGVEAMGNATRPPSDPLLFDTDGDGVGDAEDGAPHNPDSSAPEAFVPPSTVRLMKSRVYLHPDAPSVSVGIQTSEGVPALVQAESTSPGFFSVSMSSPTLVDGGGLLLSARQPFPTMTPHTFIETSALVHNLSAPLAPPKSIRVIVTRQVPQGPFEELDVGGGWSWSAWYGYFYSASRPWIWSQSHGWQYLQDNFVWDTDLLGWLYTHGDSYPWLYSFGASQLPAGWYYFAYTAGYRGFWSPTTGWIIINQ